MKFINFSLLFFKAYVFLLALTDLFGNITALGLLFLVDVYHDVICTILILEALFLPYLAFILSANFKCQQSSQQSLSICDFFF